MVPPRLLAGRSPVNRLLLAALCSLPAACGGGLTPGAADADVAAEADAHADADADGDADADAEARGDETGDEGGDAACEPPDPDVDRFASHLLGWWVMDGSGEDRSPHGNGCTAVGGARFVSDAVRGEVLELDGGGDYLDCGNATVLDPTGPLTLALWVRVRSFRVPWQSFLSRNGETCGWNLRRSESDRGAAFAVRGTSGVDDIRGSRPIDDGAWHHVAGVYDGTQRTLYVDGEVDARVPDTGAVSACPADRVLIGAMGSESGGYGFDGHDGWLDDVLIYDAALDGPAIRRLAGRGREAGEPSPPDGAPCVASDVTLRWEAGRGSCRHRVYFGTDEAAVAAAGDPGVPPGRGELAETSLDPGPLAFLTTYHWRVDEVTAEGIVRGPAWSFRTCGEIAGDLVRVPAGTFVMGISPGDTGGCRTGCGWPFDIEKPHTVNVTRDFWIKTTEVTHGEWIAAFGSTPGVFAACGDDCPVENVTWWQTLSFCNDRSAREGLPPCYFADEAGTVPYDRGAADARRAAWWVQGLDCPGYRLPTEAEWEYAARAGTTTPVFLGAATDANVAQIAWYGANSACSYARCEEDNCRSGAGGIPPSGTHPVGRKLPNAWGLYDTSGNVWEFVWDFFGEYHDGPVDDPVGPVGSAAGFHVARGGSWLNGTSEARASTRDGDDCTCDPDNGPGCHTGFRIARTAP